MIAFRFFNALTLLLMASVSAAEEAVPEFPGPAPEHALLQRFIGSWQTSGECSTGPDTPSMKNRGTMTSRMLGERWVVNDMKIDADGTPVVGVQTIGYDPTKKKYVGTWTDSMINHLWVYEGRYDENSETLVLEADGPNLMAGGAMTRFRDTYRFVTDDRIESTSASLSDEGEWVVFMTGVMVRQTD